MNTGLNYEDITGIFKNNLKIENTVKEISSIFLNDRFSKRINYKPYFQRRYVWDDDKATYFIESILLGTEIPPIVLFDNQTKNEVIDGRQRFETIKRFLDGDLVLTEDGLMSLKLLAGKKYLDLSKELQERFEETKLRLLQCSVLNEPELSDEKEDKVKKEIFRRYNSGITPLKKEEIQRAQFINDATTVAFENCFKQDKELYKEFLCIFLPKSQFSKGERDKINILLAKLRTLITLPYIPINNYANSSSKSDVINGYYTSIVSKNEIESQVSDFRLIISILYTIKDILVKNEHGLKDNTLIYECCYWVLAVILKKPGEDFNKIDINAFVQAIIDCNSESVFWGNNYVGEKDIYSVFNATGSHYHKSIIQRYTFVANYFSKIYSIDFAPNFKDVNSFKKALDNDLSNDEAEKAELDANRIIKADPTSMSIEDILKKVEKSKFLIRPPYQRSEVTNPQKSSYLLESIMLGIRIPPIFIYKRKDKVSEVVDGQQRLLSIIGFLGRWYLDENNKKATSSKNKYKLSGLKILENFNGQNIDTISEEYKNKILDFQLDVVEIDSEQNPTFSCLDLFLRLNTKPYPIEANSFEMWNAYVDKSIIMQIREIADKHCGKIFRVQDNRMKSEELIASLAYIDYKARQSNSKLYDSLNIYIRAGRINSRIKQKADITKVLSSVTAKSVSEFHYSIDMVVNFMEKIYSLIDNDLTLMGEVFANKSRYNTGKTDQNFYFLWLLLSRLEKNNIVDDRELALEKISEFFRFIQNIPRNYMLDNFFNIVDNFTF